MAAAIEDDDRLLGALEQQAVARFREAQLGVVALHGHLGVDEALLQRGDRAQVAPQRHDPLTVAEPHRRVEDRHAAALRGLVRQLAPARGDVGLRLAQQLADLGLAVG